MKNKKISTKLLAEIAIFAALAFILDIIQGVIFKSVFVNGGSIGVAMIPIIIIGYRRGVKASLLCGLLLSLIQMLGGIYIIQGKIFDSEILRIIGPAIQVTFDYILGYTVVGFCGLFFKKYQNDSKFKWILAGTILGGTLKYLTHFLSGVWFWPGEMWGFSGISYSLIYNGLYCIPNIILCCVVMYIIHKSYKQFIINDK